MVHAFFVYNLKQPHKMADTPFSYNYAKMQVLVSLRG